MNEKIKENREKKKKKEQKKGKNILSLRKKK